MQFIFMRKSYSKPLYILYQYQNNENYPVSIISSKTIYSLSILSAFFKQNLIMFEKSQYHIIKSKDNFY